jgi:hypothetical protein
VRDRNAKRNRPSPRQRARDRPLASVPELAAVAPLASALGIRAAPIGASPLRRSEKPEVGRSQLLRLLSYANLVQAGRDFPVDLLLRLLASG